MGPGKRLDDARACKGKELEGKMKKGKEENTEADIQAKISRGK